jgi:hypothetical protein
MDYFRMWEESMTLKRNEVKEFMQDSQNAAIEQESTWKFNSV